MDSSCIFCKIVAGDIPAKVVDRSDDVLVIEDVNPQAPVHLLAIPTQHSANVGTFTEVAGDAEVAKLVETAARIGREKAPGGFRLTINTGPDGGQTVDHLHVHILGGRHMTWPPG